MMIIPIKILRWIMYVRRHVHNINYDKKKHFIVCLIVLVRLGLSGYSSANVYVTFLVKNLVHTKSMYYSVLGYPFQLFGISTV